jgi:hypothetical protein
MAARCASVGACEHAGDATMNVAAAIDAHIAAAGFDVSFIWINPFCHCLMLFAGSRRFSRTKIRRMI